jgi:hypothetical protein
MNKVPFRVVLLDRRWAGGSDFDYVIEPKTHYRATPEVWLAFYQLRDWSAETWGMGMELEHWTEFKRQTGQVQNPHWCYQIFKNSQSRLRIYLRTEAELSMYTLAKT